MDALLQAAQPLLAIAFAPWGSPVTWVEVLAFMLSLAMVACNIRVNPSGWPLAIAASLLYFLLFWQHRLYGEAGLQIFFALVAGWGWWQWLRGHTADGQALRVRRLSHRGRLAVALAVLLAWPLLGALLRRYTDTDVPWWDALPTAGSIAGQWLLGRKYVENWPVWLVVNVISVGLFAYKELWLTVLLYALFAALSVVGWRAWLRKAATHG
jgi:nicotinamide mononucleotide transporter